MPSLEVCTIVNVQLKSNRSFLSGNTTYLFQYQALKGIEVIAKSDEYKYESIVHYFSGSEKEDQQNAASKEAAYQQILTILISAGWKPLASHEGKIVTFTREVS